MKFRYLGILYIIFYFAGSQAQEVTIHSIVKPLIWLNKPYSFIENTDSSIEFSCYPRTTLFSSPLGDYSNNHSCPIFQFQPSDEFVLSAKVSTPMENQWDAAQLVVWCDSANWAKLYLEKTHYFKPIVGSIVTRNFSDDCNSEILEKPEIFLQIAKIEDCIFFYYSQDGINWIFTRAFNFFHEKPIKIGFSCESTFNEKGNSAKFSKIKYTEKKLDDIFSGK